MQHPSTCSCSRRSFLRGAGLTLSGFGVASLFPTAFIDHALAGTPGSNRKLLFIFLRGGNDGLNAVIPHGDPQYTASIRPTLFIPQASGLNLNGFASLNPNLGEMMDGFNAGDLAVIHRCGYANNSRSHFDGQRVWENGTPSQTQLFEGWLYRYVRDNAVSAGVNLPVLTVQPSEPVIVRGSEKYVNIANPDDFDYVLTDPVLRDKFAATWRDAWANLVGLEPYRPVLSQTGVKLIDIIDEYATWDQANWNPLDPNTGWSLFPVDQATNQAGFPSQSFEFFRSLKVCALSLLETAGTNNGTRVAGTQLNGWDTHSNQGQLQGMHADLSRWLAWGFKALRIVLSGAALDPRGYASVWDDTTVVTLSEFGRTTRENGSRGTDHAAASCLFVAGGRVNGGVYNCDPSTWPAGVMFGVGGRYLLERTDYRAVFWEILRDHMGASGAPDAIFPGYSGLGLGSQELGLIQT
jgi:uncharacterized protein (DUF1501 family)